MRSSDRLRAVLLLILTLHGCDREVSEPMPMTDRSAAPGKLIVYGTGQVAAAVDAYRAETGLGVRLETGAFPAPIDSSRGAPGYPRADLYVVSSLAELWTIAEADQLRPTYSATIEQNVPAALRDAESRWTGLGKRARVIVYHTGSVPADEIGTVTSYAALGDETWRDRLCLSSSRIPGNQLLVALLIDRHALREAELIVRRWRANLAAPVFSDDAALVQAIADGECVLGIADSNVLAGFIGRHPDAEIAPHWFASPSDTLVDISGAGVSRHAEDPQAARRLLEWLSSQTPNALFAIGAFEFPVNPDAPVGTSVSNWTDRITASQPLSRLGFLLEEADRLSERARYR